MESLQARRAATDALTVQADRLTTSWVLPYVSPDGVSRLSDVAAARISPEIASQIEPGAQPEALLERWHEALARPAAPDLLDRRNLRPPDNVDLGRPFVTAVLRRLLRSAPSLQRIGDDRQAAVGAASRAVMLRALLEIAGDLDMRELPVHAADAGRLELPVRGARLGEGRISAADLLGFADRLLELARNHRVALPGVEIERRRDQLRSLAANRLSFDGGAVVHALGAVGAKAVLDDRFADPPRARISAPALGLLGKLDPAITIPARIRARLKAGSDRAQALADDWFAGGRIEPVMACPRFEYPMYEPLNRYDREWMIPGLGLIQKPEMATLLQTNNCFIEAYMVGLNHEMARELLWRDYPTDQRGTYFASFWTGEPELVADLHMPPWAAGTLGGHVKKELDGRLVFLVRGELIRRYPGVMAHAAREAASDRGVPILEANPPVDILFHIVLPPNVLLVGFSLTKERVTQAGETWWLTLQENPTEPRFGLDPSRAGPISRDNLIWSDFGVSAAGQFLSAARGGAVAFDDSRWGFSSAQMAYLLFQLPARAAFRATKMVEGATLHG
jgi:hypothetical protein